jgi:ubiquinone/menaquinone biosynthesis C-methylase UbiE
MEAYSIIRKSALSFVPEPLSNPGRFLDLGCGSGNSTAEIWSLAMRKNNYMPKSDFKMVGVDIDENFVNIANAEFHEIVKKYLEISSESYSELSGFIPEFKLGSTTQIPYPDEYFDHIFLSQVLHWTNLQASLDEIYRSLKPGGIFFGTNILFPRASHYLHLMLRTIEGADGFFTKEELIAKAERAGFSKFDFSTPITIFKLKKPNS